jgi:hypothetical protein
MIEDDVLREVRAAREAYARLHGFDVHAMAADLRARDLAGDWSVVRHPPDVPTRSQRLPSRRCRHRRTDGQGGNQAAPGGRVRELLKLPGNFEASIFCIVGMLSSQ